MKAMICFNIYKRNRMNGERFDSSVLVGRRRIVSCDISNIKSKYSISI